MGGCFGWRMMVVVVDVGSVSGWRRWWQPYRISDENGSLKRLNWVSSENAYCKEEVIEGRLHNRKISHRRTAS